MRSVVLAGLLFLTGCAAPQTSALLASRAQALGSVELKTVPFFAQTEHQCGPAALATVLNYSGVPITPDTLTSEVYLPGREGSLAIEMAAAVRRHGRSAWRLPPNLATALATIDQNYPVLFLQNRSLALSPIWHYAVLVGYDLKHREVVLRSGTMQREIMSLDAFEHTWARSDYWAIVVTPPEVLPAFATRSEAMQHALFLEKNQQTSAAHTLYAQIVTRWPTHDPARFGLANTAYALGLGAEAERHWRMLLDSPSPLRPAFYNLSQYLLEQGRRTEAQPILQEARQRWPSDPQLIELEKSWPPKP